MPTSKGYYLKPVGRTTTPRCLVGVQVVGRDAGTGGPCVPGRAVSCKRIVTTHSIRSWSGWSALQTIDHDTADSFWDWLEDTEWEQPLIHLSALSAGDALTLSRFWGRLEAATVRFGTRGKRSVPNAVTDGSTTGYTIRRLILSPRVTIADYERLSRRYIWTSLLQYLPMPDEKIANMCGYQEYDNETQEPVPITEGWTASNPGALIVRAMQHVCTWWRDHKGGPWPLSLGSAAAKFLRSRLSPRSVCTHRHADCLSLERAACFGGRVSCWYVGDVVGRCRIGGSDGSRPPLTSYPAIDGPVQVVDVASMYPSLLATKTFPVKLIGWERNPTTTDIECLLRYVCVVARVTLQTDQAEYPYRSQSDVYYPTGRFNTVLCGDELCHAIRNGHVVRIHAAALYESGTPFTGAAHALLAARASAGGSSKVGRARLVKLISNAITGTFAQRRTEWIPCVGAVSPCDEEGNRIQWGTWITSRGDTKWRPECDPGHALSAEDVERCRPRIITRYRAIAGLVERLERSNVGTGTLQACYAYLTSYGRSMMRDIRSRLPERSVLLQDTDGLWLTEAGYEALVTSDVALGSLPGNLRCERRIQQARIYGPKHYWADGLWTLAGMRDHSVDPANGVITYSVSHNPIRSTPICAPDTVTEYLRRCEMLLIHLHGVQGADGWVSPYRLTDGVWRQPLRDHADDSPEQ